MKSTFNTIWVFMGAGAVHPAAVFSSKEKAEEWILRYKVTGTLTSYQIDQSVYDWAIAQKHFTPKYPSQSGSEFVQRFSSAYAEHYHYEGGINQCA